MLPIDIRAVSSEPMQLGECPLWHPWEKVLYWVDINGRKVHRFDPRTARRDSWPTPSEPACLAWCKTGQLAVAARSGISLFDPRDGSFLPMVPAPYDTSIERFNDGRCDPSGRFWVGTMYEPRDRPLGSLYRLDHGVLLNSGKHVTVSNGLAFSSDGLRLYHADTTAHRIDVSDFDASSGSLSNTRVFHEFSRDKENNYGGRPDGAAIDSEDCYWCAMYEGGRILRFSPEGVLLREIALPVRCPTMVAFGGENLRTLFVTTARHNRPQDELRAHPLSGQVLALEVGVAGRPEPCYLL